jgi:hypothetical protein
MKNIISFTSAFALLLLPLATPKAIAQSTCNYNLGKTITNQTTHINLCTIQHQPNDRVNFTYSIDNEPIKAQANCRNSTWLTYPEKATHSPQSQATTDMLKIACTAPNFNDGIAIAIIFDPPSKIRGKPNGNIICTIRDITAIELSGGVTGGGEWYRTTACGGGVIHKSQIRFN